MRSSLNDLEHKIRQLLESKLWLKVVIAFIIAFTIRRGELIKVSKTSLPSTRTTQETALISNRFNSNLPETLINSLPSDPLESIANENISGIVIYSVIIGTVLLQAPFVKYQETIQELTMTIIRWAMELVPLAVFELMNPITSLGSVGIPGRVLPLSLEYIASRTEVELRSMSPVT